MIDLRSVPYLLALSTTLVAIGCWSYADVLQDKLTVAEANYDRAFAANSQLAGELDTQNRKVLALQDAAQQESEQAAARARPLLRSLPSKIKQDQAAGTRPEEMNQWFESLYR